VIRRCGGQLRASFGGVYAMDFAAVFSMASAMSVDPQLLAEVLPEAEAIVVRAYAKSNHDQ
jgi:hypothetical protein